MQQQLTRFAPAALLGLVLAFGVHIWGGNESARCGGSFEPCELGSGKSWFWTGALLILPALALLGFLWTRHLNDSGQGGPFARTLIPDWEEQAEVAGVLLAVLISYLLIRRGPTTPLTEASWPNSWLGDRLGTVEDANLAPARRTWFMIGVIMSATPSFALGSAAGREWFRWRRNRADDEPSPLDLLN